MKKKNNVTRKLRGFMDAVVLGTVCLLATLLRKIITSRKLLAISIIIVSTILIIARVHSQHNTITWYEDQVTYLYEKNATLVNQINEKKQEIAKLSSDKNQQSIQVASLEANITELHSAAEEQLDDLTNIQLSHEQLQAEYADLKSQYDQLQLQYNELSAAYEDLKTQYEDLVNSNAFAVDSDYGYMYYDTDGVRNDITPEQVAYAVQLMTERGLDPGLLLGTIMVESEGHTDCVNSSSGATGYGQFIPSTGRYIYEDVLHLGTYSSECAKDGFTNILMMATYYEIMYAKYNGDTMKVIKEYCGGGDSYASRYYQKVCNVVGYSIK